MKNLVITQMLFIANTAIVMQSLFLIVVVLLFFLLRKYRDKLGVWRWILSFSFLLYLYISYFFINKTPNIYLILLLSILFIGFFLYETVKNLKRG